MTTYKKLLKRLATHGATYENWLQYKDLAYLAVENHRNPEGNEYKFLQERFYQLANLTEFTQEQLAEGTRLECEVTYCPYVWSQNLKTGEWSWKHD